MEDEDGSPRRKWEEMDPDMLAEIFGRLALGDLLLSIPFVCKPWKAASLLPRCWRTLDFLSTPHELEHGFTGTYHLRAPFTLSGLLRLVLSRSQGSATGVHLPTNKWVDGHLSGDDLELVSNACPQLKSAIFNWMDSDQQRWLCEAVGKWKHLEKLGTHAASAELLARIGLHCGGFRCLLLSNMFVGAELATAIVEHLPRLEDLYLWDLCISREDVLGILRGCKHLVGFHINNCSGFVADEEIIQYAASIKRFTCLNCVAYAGYEHSSDDDYGYGWVSDDGSE